MTFSLFVKMGGFLRLRICKHAWKLVSNFWGSRPYDTNRAGNHSRDMLMRRFFQIETRRASTIVLFIYAYKIRLPFQNAPVLARACLLLECAYFVNRCNRGEWPAWMKMNFPMPMQQAAHMAQPPSATSAGISSSQHIAISISGPTGASSGGDGGEMRGGVRPTSQIQWAAGRLFHSWAEVSFSLLCCQLIPQ